jgi:hypothetical protein
LQRSDCRSWRPDLNRPNRRMRTRMSGGVGGERRRSVAAPYPDGTWYRIVAFSM